jgi:CheY-like chemotaxis protein
MPEEKTPPLKLLIVDDEPEILKVFKTIVEPLGYDVVAFSDSRAAAQRVNAEKFDMVAVDAHMPDPNGFELTGRIRASRSNGNVPILMFTGHDDVETMRRGFAAGITFYLAKPLSASKLRGLFAAARGMMLQERRRYVRLPLRVNVDCQSGNKRFKARSADVAQGGMLLEGSGGLAEGDIAQVAFALPGVDQPLRLMAKVVRKVEPNQLALEFIDPEPLEQAALQFYVTAKCKD